MLQPRETSIVYCTLLMGTGNIKEAKAFKKMLEVFEARTSPEINLDKFRVCFIKHRARFHQKVIEILVFKR